MYLLYLDTHLTRHTLAQWTGTDAEMLQNDVHKHMHVALRGDDITDVHPRPHVVGIATDVRNRDHWTHGTRLLSLVQASGVTVRPRGLVHQPRWFLETLYNASAEIPAHER